MLNLIIQKIIIKLSFVLIFFLGIIFFISSFTKIFHPDPYIEAIKYFIDTTDIYIKFIAFIVLNFEILAAVMLVIPKYSITGVYISIILLIVFIIYKIKMLNMGIDIECGCFPGIFLNSLKIESLFVNIILILVCIYIIFVNKYYIKYFSNSNSIINTKF